MAAGSTEAAITQAITNELAVSNKSTLATNTRQETVYVFNDASGNKNHITVNEKITDANGNETLNKTESSENAPVTMKVTYKLDGKEIKPEDLAGKSGKDKYAVYFGGNYGEVDIRMKNPDNDRTLVIFKDSFANSMVPFLMKDYAQIRMIDLRYFKRSVSKYMEENPADEVLVLYEMSSFAQADKLNKLMK